MTEEEALNTYGEIYRHFKGGIYRFLNTAKSSVDKSEWAIYEHLWPHKNELWIRPLEEFDGIHESGVKRFTLIKS